MTMQTGTSGVASAAMPPGAGGSFAAVRSGRILFTLLGIALTLTMAPHADAQTQDFLGPTLVNTSGTTDTGNDFVPRVATDGEGTWIVVWLSTDTLGGTTGEDRDIFFARSRDGGLSWSPTRPLNTNAATDLTDDWYPDIAADEAGNWVAVWHGWTNAGGSHSIDIEILYARSTDGGVSWSAPAALNTTAPGDGGTDTDWNASIAAGSGGRWIATWAMNSPSENRIYSARSANEGASWSAPTMHAAGNWSNEYPRIASNRSGNWVVVWSSSDWLEETIGTDYDIMRVRSSNDGASWTAPSPLNTNAVFDGISDWVPEIATDGSGTWVTVWLSGPSMANAGLRHSRSRNNGASWTAPATLNTDALGAPRFRVGIAGDANSNWIMVWGSQDGIQGARSTNGGMTWSAPEKVSGQSDTPITDEQPHVAADPDGQWAVTWYSNDRLGETTGHDYDILLSRLTDDSDGDGLLDVWETEGIDVDGDGKPELPLHKQPFNADPLHKDLFVEVDYMNCKLGGCPGPADTGDGHNHKLGKWARKELKKVFKAAPVVNPDDETGITLHLMDNESVPHIQSIRFGAGAVAVAPTGVFNELKHGSGAGVRCGVGNDDGHFGRKGDRRKGRCPDILEARRRVFRYLVLGHDHAHSPGSSGIGEVLGNDFMVTLGGWAPGDLTNAGGLRSAQAATVMHEMGHTLGLRHGGNQATDAFNCKPNYLSIMSYALQFESINSTRPLDYSSEFLPMLNETVLDETVGIQGPAGRSVVFSVLNTGNVVAPLPPADGPINWNGDADSTDTDASVLAVDPDPNYLRIVRGCNVPTPSQVNLTGYNDWANLIYNFRGSANYADGVHAGDYDDPSLTPEDVNAMAAGADQDGDSVSNDVDNCPADANLAQDDSDGDGRGDACDSCTNDGDLRTMGIRPLVVFRRVGSDERDGNDALLVKGGAVLPFDFSTIDPETDGVRLVVDASDGETLLDVSVPAGTFSGRGTAGWQSRFGGNAWVYHDRTESPIEGIVRVNLRNRGGGEVQVAVKGKRADYPIGDGDEPIKVVLVLGDGVGACAETAFAAPDCEFNEAGSRLRCTR